LTIVFVFASISAFDFTLNVIIDPRSEHTSPFLLFIEAEPAFPISWVPYSTGFAYVTSEGSCQQAELAEGEGTTLAMLAVMASQTILRKLGSAFWDAFTGVSSSSSVYSTGAGVGLGSSTDKVKRVLEGISVITILFCSLKFYALKSIPRNVVPNPAHSVRRYCPDP